MRHLSNSSDDDFIIDFPYVKSPQSSTTPTNLKQILIFCSCPMLAVLNGYCDYCTYYLIYLYDIIKIIIQYHILFYHWSNGVTWMWKTDPPGNHYKPDNAKIICALLHKNWIEEKSFVINSKNIYLRNDI